MEETWDFDASAILGKSKMAATQNIKMLDVGNLRSDGTIHIPVEEV